MKKLSLVLIALCISIGYASAQQLSFGAKAEANFSNHLLKDLPGATNSMGPGVTLGGFAKIELSEHFALQPELLFSFKHINIEMSGEIPDLGPFDMKGDVEYWGMEIPVYALGQWKAGSGQFYAGLGPWFAYGFSMKSYYGDGGMGTMDLYSSEYDDMGGIKRFDLGLGALAGYELACGLQFNAGYKLGLINAAESAPAKMHSQTLSIGLGYRF